ncbi:MAG TPA: TetR family transcriptional regulator [Rhodanobacteraceae bacterium]
MTSSPGTARPGGRTAQTRQAVLAATRELLAQSTDGTIDVAAVAARAGVHVATLYRRWRNADGLIIDALASEMNRRSPIPASGDLRADMLVWAARLQRRLNDSRQRYFLRALLRAGDGGQHSPDDLQTLAGPRLRDIQATLDASHADTLTWLDVFEVIVAPAYTHALLGIPMDASADAARLVDNLIAIRDSRAARKT